MPKKKKPASAATKIKTFLSERPDEQFRCVELAEHFDLDTQRAASECGRLYRNGLLERVHVDVRGRSQPLTYYKWRP